MVNTNICIYSKDKILGDIISYDTFIPERNIFTITDLSELNNMEKNIDILVFMVSDKVFDFEELLLIPEFVNNNLKFDILFYIPLKINEVNPEDEYYLESINIRLKTSAFLKNNHNNLYICHEEQSLMENLHALYRSHLIGSLIGYNSLHTLVK